MPLVTVVIPCFNQACFLDDAIASVTRQAVASCEIIVVDDGSTDDTAAVAAGRGATVLRQANRGLGAARNAGLRAASGEYVVFLDADDELMPAALQNGVEVLGACPEADCVVRRCQLIDRSGRLLPTLHANVDAANLYSEWLRFNFVWTPGAAVFRTAALRQIGGFPEDVGPAADYAVYLTLARTGRVVYDRRDVVRYRQHDSNMSRDAARMLSATLTVLRREYRSLPEHLRGAYRLGLQEWRRFYGEQMVHELRGAWRMRRFTRADAARALLLVSECPAVVWTHVRRKAGRLVRRGPPGDLECSRGAPVLRRPVDSGH